MLMKPLKDLVKFGWNKSDGGCKVVEGECYTRLSQSTDTYTAKYHDERYAMYSTNTVMVSLKGCGHIVDRVIKRKEI